MSDQKNTDLEKERADIEISVYLEGDQEIPQINLDRALTEFYSVLVRSGAPWKIVLNKKGLTELWNSPDRYSAERSEERAEELAARGRERYLSQDETF